MLVSTLLGGALMWVVAKYIDSLIKTVGELKTEVIKLRVKVEGLEQDITELKEELRGR